MFENLFENVSDEVSYIRRGAHQYFKNQRFLCVVGFEWDPGVVAILGNNLREEHNSGKMKL